MIKIVTHNGDFHADDVFAVATLVMHLEKVGEKYRIIRTRDEEIIEKGDYVVDVGGIYDEEENRYDHHQESFNEKGLFSIPYSSFGLVWKRFGPNLCSEEKSNKAVFKKIAQNFVTIIDANDNGVDTTIPAIQGLIPITPERFIFSWHPPYNMRTEESLYSGFVEAVDFARGFLEREIEKAKAKEDARDEFEHALRLKKNTIKTDSLLILLLPKPLPWRDFLDEENDYDFVVMQRDDENWMAVGVPVKAGAMKIKNVKKSWAGLKDEDLSSKAGVPDLIFYHKTGYILVGKTKEAILAALDKF